MNTETLRLLVAKGLSAEDILEISEAMDCKTRSQNAERQARFRARRKAEKENVTNNVTSNGVTPPNDIYSNPPVLPLSAKADCPPLAERVVSAWNDGPKASGATGATALDANRRKWLVLRVREHGEEAVFTAIRNLAQSPFHCGANDRGWRANIGWLLKSPENFLKALEMGDARAPPAPVNPLIEQAMRYAQPH